MRDTVHKKNIFKPTLDNTYFPIPMRFSKKVFEIEKNPSKIQVLPSRWEIPLEKNKKNDKVGKISEKKNLHFSRARRS